MIYIGKLRGITSVFGMFLIVVVVFLMFPGCKHDNYANRGISQTREILELPGKIEAEYYQLAGRERSDPDLNSGDSGQQYQDDDVVISRDGDGFSARLEEGDWLSYSVEILEGGAYRLSSRVKSAALRNSKFRIMVGEEQVADPIEFGSSTKNGSVVDSWQNIEMDNIKLPSGVQELRIVAEQGDFSIDYIKFAPEIISEGPPLSEQPIEELPSDGKTGDESDVPVEFSFRIEEIGSLSNISSNRNMFSTALAYHEGSVYTVNVESGSGSDGLVTVVRKGTPDVSGNWIWAESHIIDDDTFKNDYHTQASIAIDKLGYVHVAYNMHNMPWQYSVSVRPGDISEFDFLGDPISAAQRNAIRVNRTPFPSLGTAAIPGNQITYPAFFYDRNGELYITYRFATRPKRSFVNRGFAGGVARYDTETRSWEALGGDIVVTSDDADIPGGGDSARIRAFAYSDRWSVYQIWLSFDELNNMHVSWFWREGGAGPSTSHPSYAFSSDDGYSFTNSKGVEYNLPISVQRSELFIREGDRRTFGHRSSIAVNRDSTPYIYSEEKGENRMLRRLVYRAAPGEWSVPQDLPGSATEVLIDEEGRFWAFATGPKIFVRDLPEGEWENIHRQEHGYSFLRTLKIPQERKIVLYSMNDSAGKVKIHMITY